MRLPFVAFLILAGCASEAGPLPARDSGTPPDIDAGPEGCLAPRVMCGGSCVSTDTDPLNCGGCRTECRSGSFCNAGHCETSCPSGRESCGGACVDLATDHDHCGDCDMPCSGDRECAGGSCQCPEHQTECDGTCTDVRSDPMNCGLCGRTCLGTEICNMGSCGGTAPGREAMCNDMTDDDGDGATDCEDDDCTGATRSCMSSCGTGVEMCEAGGTWGACSGGTGGAEICGDGIDQDCDGMDLRMPDMWEPNDECATCIAVEPGMTDPNVYLDATFDSVDDNIDCYKYNVDDNFGPGEDINVDLTAIPPGADYDIYLYRSVTDCAADRPLAFSNLLDDADEHISWGESFGSDDSGTYVVKVVRYRGNSCDHEYRLTFNGLN